MRAYYGTLETSFISYEQAPARPEKVRIGSTDLPLADMELLAVMKAAAVHDRGAKRDFIDIHAICREPGWSVRRFIWQATRHLPLEPEQVGRAMTYFVDAERDPMPAGCRIPWETVKRELSHAVQRWERTRDPGLER